MTSYFLISLLRSHGRTLAQKARRSLQVSQANCFKMRPHRLQATMRSPRESFAPGLSRWSGSEQTLWVFQKAQET
jgi:hypothetical protein